MLNTSTIQITPEILKLISQIDEFKGAWRALETLAPERLSALRKVATIESIGSSTRIEGSKLSDKDVERLLSNLEIKTFASRDEQEVAGYAKVMETVFTSWEHLLMTENYIQQLHKDAFAIFVANYHRCDQDSICQKRESGEYRRCTSQNRRPQVWSSLNLWAILGSNQ